MSTDLELCSILNNIFPNLISEQIRDYIYASKLRLNITAKDLKDAKLTSLHTQHENVSSYVFVELDSQSDKKDYDTEFDFLLYNNDANWGFGLDTIEEVLMKGGDELNENQIYDFCYNNRAFTRSKLQRWVINEYLIEKQKHLLPKWLFDEKIYQKVIEHQINVSLDKLTKAYSDISGILNIKNKCRTNFTKYDDKYNYDDKDRLFFLLDMDITICEKILIEIELLDKLITYCTDKNLIKKFKKISKLYKSLNELIFNLNGPTGHLI